MIIRKVPGMQLPDLASTSLFTAVGLNHKKLARPSESPTNSPRSWLPRFLLSESMLTSSKVYVHQGKKQVDLSLTDPKYVR